MNFKKHKWLPILLVVLLVVAVVAHWCLWKKGQKFGSYDVVQTQNARRDNTQDLWKTHVSQDYEISYPVGAKISLIDPGPEPYRCTKIEYNGGYVLINVYATVPCAGSDAGVGSSKKIEEKVIINGNAYTSSGFLSPNNTFSFASFAANKITLFTYGVSQNKGMTEADYTKTINSLKTMMATFRS